MNVNNTLAIFPSQLLGADNQYTSNDQAYYKELNLAEGSYYSPVVKRISICDGAIKVTETTTTTYKEKKQQLGS